VICRLLEYNALLEAQQLGVDLTYGEIFFCSKRGDDWIVVEVEASEDVGDQVVVINRLVGGGHLITQDAHLVDVVADGEAALLGGCKSDPGVDGVSFGGRSEVAFDNGPCFWGGATLVNLGQSFFCHGW
jgi:hypothetical protein